jgi:hypothetical protein
VTPRAYLRQALRQLRAAFDPIIEVTTEGDVLAVAGSVTTDSVELDALVGAAAVETGEQRPGPR